MRQIAADDAEKESLYDLWLQDRDWIKELNKAVAEYEKSAFENDFIIKRGKKNFRRIITA